MFKQPDYTQTRWNGWGSPDKVLSLPERPNFQTYLTQKLGVYQFFPVPGLELSEISLLPSRLSDGARGDLSAFLSSDALRVDLETRARHSFGRSYPDLVKARTGQIASSPDAVLFPETAREVRQILEWAAAHQTALVPFGGGTSVVGGVEPKKLPHQDLVLSLDLRRLDKILRVESVSQTATVEPGIRGPVLEERLQPQGLTLGHYPQSFEYSTLGGWIATRSVGEYSLRYGSAEDMVLSLNLETPCGPLEVAGGSRATGPEPSFLLVGSEGCCGIITLAEIRLHRKPEARRTLAYFLPEFEVAANTARELIQQRLPVASLRLLDEDANESFQALQPTGGGFADYLRRGIGRAMLRRKGFERPCLAILSLHGGSRQVERWERELAAFMESRQGFDAGQAIAQQFARERLLWPYLRDTLMDFGILADTFDTFVPWTRLTRLRQNVRAAIAKACSDKGVRCSVEAQVAHPSEFGACLMVSLLASVGPGEELEVWRDCKVAATEAILRGGGRLSHHSGIGAVNREWMVQEHGPLASAALGSLKRALDPAGIMNPGKVFSDGF